MSFQKKEVAEEDTEQKEPVNYSMLQWDNWPWLLALVALPFAIGIGVTFVFERENWIVEGAGIGFTLIIVSVLGTIFGR